MKPRPSLSVLVLALALALAAAPVRAADVLDLPIGDAARRDHSVPLVLDAVTDSRSGQLIGPGELAARLDGVRLLLVGENHTSMEFHRVQLRILEELVARGRTVAIGLEMYPATAQAQLERWSSDPKLTEADFLTDSRWYLNWGYNWNYYRDIFLLAHRHRLPMYGLNVPRKIVSTMRKEGRDALTPEQAQLLPERIDTDSAEHRRLVRAMFDDPDGLHGAMSDEQFEGMYRAQCTWDGAMAHNALRALAASKDESTILVVLVGSGHVAYGLGLERQARLSFGGKIASVVPVTVEDPDTDAQVESVRGSFADFVWGVPLEHDPLYPSLGLATSEGTEGGPLEVLFVNEGSVAETAGFAAGDRLVAMDGTALDGRETLNRLMAAKRWADDTVFSIRRGEQEISLLVHFRRTLDEPETPAAESPETSGAKAPEPQPSAGGSR
ncbi:MAG: ChaN family lipoprotein [Acidobacteria bacterium]|nr:ChaN family lipoprotein [Acidobacteriota bacterium]